MNALINEKDIDWTIAKIEKIPGAYRDGAFLDGGVVRIGGDPGTAIRGRLYSPSTDYKQGGELIDKYRVETFWSNEHQMWCACLNGHTRYGVTRLKAAMWVIAAAH